MSKDNSKKIKITTRDKSTTVTACLLSEPLLGEPLAAPCSSSEGEGPAGTPGWQNQEENEKNNWKVRFDNGHSSENQALNWHKAVWWVFKVKWDSTHYPLHHAGAAAALQAALLVTSAFIDSVEPWHAASWIFCLTQPKL